MDIKQLRTHLTKVLAYKYRATLLLNDKFKGLGYSGEKNIINVESKKLAVSHMRELSDGIPFLVNLKEERIDGARERILAKVMGVSMAVIKMIDVRSYYPRYDNSLLVHDFKEKVIKYYKSKCSQCLPMDEFKCLEKKDRYLSYIVNKALRVSYEKDSGIITGTCFKGYRKWGVYQTQPNSTKLKE